MSTNEQGVAFCPTAPASDSSNRCASTQFVQTLLNSLPSLAITGDAQISGTLRLAATTTPTTGVILKGGNRFIHDFKAASSDGYNTFVGTNAGNFTMAWDGVHSYTASTNVGIGSLTLASLTTGYANMAIGFGALTATTTGNSNLAVGTYALLANSTGYANVAIGTSAQASGTTAFQNVSIGTNSLYSNTTGIGNTAIGNLSLFELNIVNSTDGQNTAIGYNTGRGITTGKNNTIIGANVTGLAAALTGNIILSDGIGAVKLWYDGSVWDHAAPVKVKNYTVGTLPAASVGAGSIAYVTDANATTQNAVVAAGGANKVLVFSDGTNWRIS